MEPEWLLGFLIRATVETVSENLSDGVIAPLFFLFLGGVPLGLLYKAVNTLDSMVGYRNERFEYLGKFSARCDDLMNFVPARISPWLLIAAAWILRKDVRGAVSVWRQDRKKHQSPNSAHTEAACAGALGIRLGSAVLMYTASALALAVGILIFMGYTLLL